MTSHGKTEWADRLIPNLDQSATADLISRLCDFAFIISSDGEITQTVTSPFLAPKLDLTPWTGLQFKDTLTKESVPKFEARLAEFQRGQKEVRPVELNHRATDQQAELPVRYTYHSGAADGSTLLLGSDLRPVAEMQQQLVEAQIALENDYDARREHEIRLRVLMDSSDVATVFITLETGAIVSCNSAAEILLGRPRNELIDASFASEFEDEGLTSLIDRMVTAASDASMGAILAKSALGGRSYRLDPTLFRGATSQMLLCKIQPEEPDPGTRGPTRNAFGQLFPQRGRPNCVRKYVRSDFECERGLCLFGQCNPCADPEWTQHVRVLFPWIGRSQRNFGKRPPQW